MLRVVLHLTSASGFSPEAYSWGVEIDIIKEMSHQICAPETSNYNSNLQWIVARTYA